MNYNISVLQICSYYVRTNLYQNLFNSLERFNIEENVYIFVDKDYEINKKYKSNICISKCYYRFDRLFFHLKHFKVLKDIKSKMDISKYNIIHAHSLFSNGYIAYKLNKKYNIPYVVAVRNTDVNLFFKKMLHLRNLGIRILLNAKKVIFISESYKKYVIENYIPVRYREKIENKSIVIPNGIDEFWLNNKFKHRKFPQKNNLNIIYAGNIDRNKNVETTIKACKILIEQGYKVKYKIIGKIKYNRYRSIINRHSFVEYIPFCQKEELINYYRSSDIFVMPSKHETFGLVYAEAMSQGLPVIYTRGQGFDGHFEEGEVGYSVQYDSAEEIVQRIKDIIENYEYISSNCINKVDKFDWNLIAKNYYNIYKDVL